MSEIQDNKLKANELRKKGDIESALPLYKELWENTQDKFAAAGLIFCYRKQKRFEEALPIAEESYLKFSTFDWCRNEYIWTLIQGKLYTFPEDGQLSDLISIVEKVLEAKPDEIAFKITIFKLLKAAKKQGNWEVLNEWITKIDPNILDGYTDETTGWTDKELWYYYRVNGLIHSHKEEEAIQIVENNAGEFYKQKKFFERLKAKANINLGKLEDAEKSYKALVSSKSDWWLLYEYGNLLLKQNKAEDALSCFINAALIPPMKLELKVSLFTDIANLFILLNKKDYALSHLLLVKSVREEQGWGLGDLNDKISGIRVKTEEKEEKRALLNECKAIWREFIGNGKIIEENSIQTKNLRGKVINLNNGKPFCFIKTKDNQSYFCSKNDLPNGVTEEHFLKFDLKPTIDKKKNEKSFKAVNIRIN